MGRLSLHAFPPVPSLSSLRRMVRSEEGGSGARRANSFNPPQSPLAWLLLSQSARVLPETTEPKRRAGETSLCMFRSHLVELTLSTPQNSLGLEAARIFSGPHATRRASEKVEGVGFGLLLLGGLWSSVLHMCWLTSTVGSVSGGRSRKNAMRGSPPNLELSSREQASSTR